MAHHSPKVGVKFQFYCLISTQINSHKILECIESHFFYKPVEMFRIYANTVITTVSGAPDLRLFDK